jgi:hypothetical protein
MGFVDKEGKKFKLDNIYMISLTVKFIALGKNLVNFLKNI